jgi:transposase InsO family protein
MTTKTPFPDETQLAQEIVATVKRLPALKEAQIVIERWRVHYNTIRPHSSLGYRPPAPETIRPPQHDQASALAIAT